MDYLPVFLNVSGCPAVVVGGGHRAAAKVRLLVAAGAEVSVVAPWACGEITALASASTIRHAPRRFAPADSDGACVIFAASGKADVDAGVAAAARARGIPVNIVDGPRGAGGSSFIMPAIVDRDPVVVAVSSGGQFPGLVREVRARIEALLPARLGAVAHFAARFRATVRLVIGEEAARRRFWQQVLDGPIARAIIGNDERAAGDAMLALLNGRDAPRTAFGVVYLVGAGPGAADLLTLRALQVLQRADLVIYDRLVGERVLDLARRDAERVCADAAPGGQNEINAITASAARSGKSVVRLKAGDPFLFGRGAEEAASLRARGVAVEIVPGLAAAAGWAADDHAAAVAVPGR
jgi:uroporphyrin-III C-methyltransferase/precorrin-2 dehydrogenase/sirohydrochlorin ferrochelatase